MKTEQSEQIDQIEHNEKKKRRKHFGGPIKKLFSQITDVLDGIDADFEDRSNAKKTLLAMLKLRAPICIFLASVMALSACYFALCAELPFEIVCKTWYNMYITSSILRKSGYCCSLFFGL